MSFGNHDEVAGGVRHSHFMQGLHGDRNHAQGFAGLLKLPAGDGDHSIRLQVLEVFAERFDRVQAVFAQGKGAGGGGGPGVDQRHLHDVELLLRIAHKRPAVGDVNVHLGPLVQMKGVVGVAAAHDGVGNDGIDLDSGNARAAIAHRAQDVHAAAGADDGVVAVRAQHVGQRRRRRHQISLPGTLPMFGIDVHQVGGGVGIDHDRLALALGIYFDARDGIPARELDPGGIAEASLGVNDVEESAGVVDGDQDQHEQRASGGRSSRPAVDRPDRSCQGHADGGKKHGVRSAQPIEQRDDGQAGQRSSRQIGGVERRNVPGLARKHDGEFQSGDKEGNGRSQVDGGEPEEIRLRNVQRDRNAQHDHQHHRHDQRVNRT